MCQVAQPRAGSGCCSNRRSAELALSLAWGLFLHRCNHCPYLPLPVQDCVSARHYSSHYFITWESWLFTEGISSWLNSDSRVFWAPKLSLVLTWNNFPLINLWILWFCSCIWKILNVVACLCFLFIFCLEKLLSAFLWSHLFSPGLWIRPLPLACAAWWHTSQSTPLFAQLFFDWWLLLFTFADLAGKLLPS